MTYKRKIKILSESSVCRWLEISSDQLTELRRKYNFPFIQISKTKRAYDEEDVTGWLLARKQVLRPVVADETEI